MRSRVAILINPESGFLSPDGLGRDPFLHQSDFLASEIDLWSVMDQRHWCSCAVSTKSYINVVF